MRETHPLQHDAQSAIREVRVHADPVARGLVVSALALSDTARRLTGR